MKLVTSKQTNVVFSWCPNPTTIDKSASWGTDNLQEFPNGAFLKHDNHGVITHGVQPNEDQTAPVGWRPLNSCIDGNCPQTCYEKLPIWVHDETVYHESVVPLQTLDGLIKYKVTEPSVIVAQDENGNPSEKDIWIMTIADLKKNYNYEEANN